MTAMTRDQRRKERCLVDPEYREKLRQKRQERDRRRSQTEEYRARRKLNQARYEKSDKGAATRSRYWTSDRYRETMKRWRQTPQGLAYTEMRRASRAARRPSASAGRYSALEHLRSQLLSDAVYAAAHALVPRYLPEFVRDDIISDLCLGVLDGEFALADMEHHVKSATARNRGATDRFGTVSLDAVIGGKGYTHGHALGVY